MKRKNLVKNVWGIGLTLLLLFGCSPQATLTPTPVPPTATPTPIPEGPRLGQWTATADFGTFTFGIEPGINIVMGTFDFPSGFSCGTSKVTGTSFKVFDINTTFPPPNPFGAPPPTPQVLIVKFPVSGMEFSAGPFWVGTTVPTTGQRIPFMTMVVEGRFDSATEASGHYTADAVKHPTSTELQGTLCHGTFTAEWTLP
jgi:hypothetical protein